MPPSDYFNDEEWNRIFELEKDRRELLRPATFAPINEQNLLTPYGTPVYARDGNYLGVWADPAEVDFSGCTGGLLVAEGGDDDES